jgi:hypothetical protein
MRMGARMRLGRSAAPASLRKGPVPVSPGNHRPMIDREKVLAVLRKRFPGAAAEQVAAAANAIVGLEDEWDDVTGHEPEFGYHFSAQCGEICYLAEQQQQGGHFRVFRRRASGS